VARNKKLYMVQRLAWRPVYNEDIGRAGCEQHESPEGVPVRAFDTKARAAKYARHLTAEARRELNPFQFTYEDIEAIMNGEEDDLVATVEKLQLPSPREVTRQCYGASCIDWPRWYDEVADDLGDAERDAIWDMLDCVELYRVVEVKFLLEM
jgi:hypothetical protein